MYNGSKKDKGEAIHRTKAWESRGNRQSKGDDQKENSVGKSREDQGGTSENKWEENNWGEKYPADRSMTPFPD